MGYLVSKDIVEDEEIEFVVVYADRVAAKEPCDLGLSKLLKMCGVPGRAHVWLEVR